ncbi:hypothetical protein GQ457_06G030710 [Hibiscus cannabinus]
MEHLQSWNKLKQKTGEDFRFGREHRKSGHFNLNYGIYGKPYGLNELSFWTGQDNLTIKKECPCHSHFLGGELGLRI